MGLDFFGSQGSPYYIWAPDYRKNSAGIRALHQLCHVLNQRGEEAYIAFGNVTLPQLRTPKLTKTIVEEHFLTGRTPIVLYPEVVHGNPFKAPLVARWMLNKPGHLGGDSDYHEDEILFHFDEWIVPTELKEKSYRLTTVAVNPNIFNTGKIETRRKGQCYFANKYLAFGGKIPTDLSHAKSLCLDVSLSQDELADIFRSTEVLYCFEQSSIIPEALACGCPVLLVPSPYWPANETARFAHVPGVAIYGEKDALAKANCTIANYPERAREFHRWCEETIEQFIVVSQSAGTKFRNSITKDSTQTLERIENNQDIWRTPPGARRQFRDGFETYWESIANDLGGPKAPTLQDARSNCRSLALTQSELRLFESRASEWTTPVLFHVIIIQDDVPDALITRSIESLNSQHYSQVIATVISQHQALVPMEGGRLEWWTSTDNHRIVANEVITQSPAQWCAVVRAGDQLAPEALLMMAEFIHSHPEHIAIYTDEDVVDDAGEFVNPSLKPDFDRERLYSCGYVGGLLAARKEAWLAVGGLRPLQRGHDEFDVALRLTCASSVGLGHLPRILYHRHHGDPALQAPDTTQDEIKKAVLQEILTAIGTEAEVSLGLAPGLLHVRYPLKHTPGVTMIVPTKDRVERLDRLISSILAETAYPDYELLILDNGSTGEKARAYLAGLAEIDPLRIRVVPYPHAFNHAAILNHGASLATKDLLLFLHDDDAVIHRDWLANMVSLFQRPGVKAVGGRLLSADGTGIVEAGIVPSQVGILGRPFAGWPINRPAPLGRLHAVQGVPAISSACMLVAKEDFLSLGGMDSEHFPEKFADVDFCIKLRQGGHTILWTPYATLTHDTDNTTWGDKSDNNALLEKWGKALSSDPLHNPYVALGSDTSQPEAESVFIPDVITWHPVPNVYAMSSDQDGAGNYRVIQPVEHATDNALIRGRVGRGYPVPVMMEKLDVDVVFSQRQLEDRQIENLTRYRRLLDCKIILDFDDLLTNVPDKNIHKRTLLKDMKGRLRKVGDIAHRFTVSTQPLAQEFKQFHDDICVVPNALLRSQWAHLNSQRGTSRKLRVGWAGGVSHQGDLEVVRDVVRELSDEVEWVFMGMCLQELNAHIKEFHAGAPFNAYPQELAKLHLDLAIAPLELNPFNECKSHLRILEYGILGIPVIATNITPYQSGFPITLVKNKHQDWVKAIREHINDVDETYKRGDALRQYILDNWMLDQHLEAWRDAWTI